MDKGNITIATNPSGAKIYVDSVLMNERTPATLSLNEGFRYIVLEIDGYNKDFNRIYIVPGSTVSLERNMTKLPYGQFMSSQRVQKWIKTYFMSDQIIQTLPNSTPTTSAVVITTYPAGATIEMDGKTVIDIATKRPLTTPVQLEAGMGQHNFIFRLQGYCNEFETVYIIPGTGPTYVSKTFSTC